MSVRLTDSADALRDQGLEPVLVDGCMTRGEPFPEIPRCHVRHWTAGGPTGRAGSLGTVTHGRGQPNPLKGPLCWVLQERTGGPGLDRVFLVATGVANHAGESEWMGIRSLNTRSTGNEIEWSGPSEPFPGNRIETSERIAAAAQSMHPVPSSLFCCEHRECAKPEGRKQDTNLDGATFRNNTQSLLLNPGEDDLDPAEKAMLTACTQILGRLEQGLMPRTPVRVATSGSNMGNPDPQGELVSDLWRWVLKMEQDRQEGFPTLAKSLAAEVRKILPASAGGVAGPTLAEIQNAVRTAIRAEVSFLKPGE